MTRRVRVYIACSLDGFIAGPDDDLSWLPGGDQQEVDVSDGGAIQYEDFMADVGVILMGRRTHDVVRAFGIPWPYSGVPVMVATNRPLDSMGDDVRAVKGSIEEVVDAARVAAGEGDVYLDGGAMIRQALSANLIDELIVTIVPTILGRGVPLFAGLDEPHALDLIARHAMGPAMTQLVLKPAPSRA